MRSAFIVAPQLLPLIQHMLLTSNALLPLRLSLLLLPDLLPVDPYRGRLADFLRGTRLAPPDPPTHLIQHPLQRPLRLAFFWESGQVEIRRSVLHQPLWPDLGDGADEIGRGEDEFIVNDPFGCRIESTGEMQADDLVVLDSEVAALFPFLMRDLHEKATDEGLADVVPVVLVLPCGADELEVVFLHVAFELGADVVGLGEGSKVEVVLPAPVFVALVGFVRVVDVEEGEVVAVGVGELGFGHVGFFACVGGAHEDVGHCVERTRSGATRSGRQELQRA